MDYIVTTNQLGEVLGVADSYIRRLEREGILQKVSRGKFDVRVNVQRFLQYKASIHEVEDQEIDYNREKALHEHAKRRIAELDLAEREDQLIEVDEVCRELTKMISVTKTRFLSLPSKLAPMLQFENNIAAINEILRKEIYACLQELSNLYAKETEVEVGK